MMHLCFSGSSWQLHLSSAEILLIPLSRFCLRQTASETGFFYTLQLIFIEGISVHRTDALTLSSLSDPINKIKRNHSCEAYLTRPLLYVLVVTHIYDQPFFFYGFMFLTAFIQLNLGSQTLNCLIYYQVIVSKNCIVKLNTGFFMICMALPCSSLRCCQFFYTSNPASYTLNNI